jgi:rsbT co-antagonist protein RsbR
MMRDGGDDLLLHAAGGRDTSGGPGPAGSGGRAAGLIDHFDSERALIYQDWAARIAEEGLLKPIRREEVDGEIAALFDRYMESLRDRKAEALVVHLRQIAARYLSRGVAPDEIVGMFVVLREVLDRSIRRRYAGHPLPDDVVDGFTRSTTRVKLALIGGFLREREVMIQEQQDAMHQLSTPVLRVRNRLLILPIVGPINSRRARQLTEQLLMGIRNHRAKVAVIDITGVPFMDGTVANHLVQAVLAARLLGATVITTGLAPEIAQTLVQIGIDLAGLRTVGDLQGGIEEAERLLGYHLVTDDGTDVTESETGSNLHP